MDAYVADRARVGKTKSTLESHENVNRRLTAAVASTPPLTSSALRT